MSLKNKIALVTGSTSGIGLGIAKSLASQGCHLVLNGIADAETAKNLQAGIEKEFGVKTFFSGANMASATEIKKLFTDTRAALGEIDILVNNAGIQHVAEVENFPVEKWDSILAINLSSAFHTTQNAMASMKAKNWG
ncbi:MAG: SDR family NAD(P)-dependent oxidoreductase, partial [Pseudobdellovibrio sp.]